MKTRTRYGLMLMLIAAIMWAFVQSVHCQEAHLPKHPPHTTETDFWDSLRILPVKILFYDPASGIMDAQYSDAERLEVIQFQMTQQTATDGTVKGKVMIIYCAAAHGTGLNERIKYLLQIEKAK